MNKYENGAESTAPDFNPDLSVPNENVKAENISISINKHNSSALQRLQDYGIDATTTQIKFLQNILNLIPQCLKTLKD